MEKDVLNSFPTTWTETLTKQLSKSRLGKIFAAKQTFMAFRDNLQPWSSFLNPSSFCSPEPNEIITRVQGNIEYFASNYIVMFLIIFIGSLLSKPYFLLCMIVIASLWFYLHSMKKLVIQGFEVETIHKNILMLSVSSIALLIFAWNAIFISI